MNFFFSTDLTIEPGSSKSLVNEIKSLTRDGIGCIYDGGLSGQKYFEAIKTSLSSAFNNIVFYSTDFGGEPTYGDLERITDRFRKDGITLIVAIGGGSTIDIGKGVALLLTNNRPALSLRGFPIDISDPIPVVTMPSLVGSGAEVSFNAVFIDENEKRKLGINSRRNFPKRTIIDPLLTRTAPKDAIVSSAMDTLVHCVDSFGSRKHTPFSRVFSIEGFKRTLRVLLSGDIRSVENHTELAIGSVCGTTALMNSGDGPTNGFSYHVGVEKGIPHGLAGAIFLLEVMKYNYRNGYTEYAALNLEQGQMSSDEMCIELFRKMEAIYKEYKIPKLSDYGYDKDNIETLAIESSAALKGSFSGNPVEFDKEAAFQVLSGLL